MHTNTSVAVPALLSALILGCAGDVPDGTYECDVVSPNNSWSANNVTMTVTAPRCPVKIDYQGYSVYYSSRTQAPNGMPEGELQIEVDDGTGDFVTGFIGIWAPISGGKQEAQTSGYYSAGRDGIPLTQPNIHDIAVAVFLVTPAYGSGFARGVAVLPYKFSGTVSGLKFSASQWSQPKVGVPTYVRVVPQVDEFTKPVTGFDWYFDNKKVLDTARSTDPRVPKSPDRLFKAKVWTKGTHTWKVIMKYGSYPNTYTSTITWNQTFN